MATKNDKVILNLKKEISNKKQLLSKASKFQPVTSCIFTLNGVKTNIHILLKEEILLAIATIQSLEFALKQVFPNEPLIISGFKSEDWITDLKARFLILNETKERQRLKVLEDRLHDLLSVDTKVSLEIEDLKAQI